MVHLSICIEHYFLHQSVWCMFAGLSLQGACKKNLEVWPVQFSNPIIRNDLNSSSLLKMGTLLSVNSFFQEWNSSIGILCSMQCSESTVCLKIAMLNWYKGKRHLLCCASHIYQYWSVKIFKGKQIKTIVWTGAYWKIALVSNHWSIVCDKF